MLEMSTGQGGAPISSRVIAAPRYFGMEMGNNLNGLYYKFSHDSEATLFYYGGCG